MNFYSTVIPALFGVSIVLAQSQVGRAALPSTEISKIAKSITVQVSHQSPGSGVLIKKEGETYTVLTAAHVVSQANKYEIVTADGQRYNGSTIKTLPDVDLALVQFKSNKNYTTAKVGNSDQTTEGNRVYVAGFPVAKAAISRSIYLFTEGIVNANATEPLRDGYALAYSNNTLPGMSGGAVINENGELVGIHGRGDTAENFQTNSINPGIVVKTGFNLGIPINTRSEEHTSELQSRETISYAVFCLKKKKEKKKEKKQKQKKKKQKTRKIYQS